MHWNDANWTPGWKGFGSGADYQATFTIMKGLTALSVEEFGTPEIDWQAEFDTALLAHQQLAGNWPATQWDPSPPLTSTIWALLTLQRAAPVALIPVAVDVKPSSCPNPFNMKSNGVLPLAIAGTQTFNVLQVGPATVRLENVAPIRWTYEDVATPFEPFLNKMGAMACTGAGADRLIDCCCISTIRS